MSPAGRTRTAVRQPGIVKALDADAEVQEHATVLVVPVDEAGALSPALLDAVVERARAGTAVFHFVVPDPAPHAELTAAQRRDSKARGEVILQRALSRLSAAGHSVEGSVSLRHDPMDVIEEALRARDVDEIMIALSRHPVRERLHLDLPHRVAHLGIPVTTVTLEARVR